MLLGQVEGQVEIVQRTVLGELVVVQQVRPVTVDERAQSQAVFPAHVEILYVHVLVRCGLGEGEKSPELKPNERTPHKAIELAHSPFSGTTTAGPLWRSSLPPKYPEWRT